MFVGYMRISGDGTQTLALQRDALTEAASTRRVCMKTEPRDGGMIAPASQRVCKALQPGNTLVVWKWCRATFRSLRNSVALPGQLGSWLTRHSGVLHDPWFTIVERARAVQHAAVVPHHHITRLPA